MLLSGVSVGFVPRSKAKMAGPSILCEGLLYTSSWRERLRIRTTQSSWHQPNLQTSLHPLQAPGGWERCTGQGVGPERHTQLLATCHLKGFQNSQAACRLLSGQGCVPQCSGELGRKRRESQNQDERTGAEGSAPRNRRKRARRGLTFAPVSVPAPALSVPASVEQAWDDQQSSCWFVKEWVSGPRIFISDLSHHL